MSEDMSAAVAEAREEIVAMGREMGEALYVEHPANAWKREREVAIAGELADALITAARADERAQWAVADRARIIREVVEKLPGIAAPEADFIAVEWFTEAGRFPYRVAMPRAALLDALLGTDGQEPA